MATVTMTAPDCRRDYRRHPHPVYGLNWHDGDEFEPAGLLSDAPHYGPRAELNLTIDADLTDLVAEAAPGVGLTFDGFLHVALNDYLARQGTTFAGLIERAAREHLARIGRD